MNDNFSFLATLKSDQELQNCIDNREKYMPETVEAAVKELQSRGVILTEDELTVIAEDVQARRDQLNSGANNYGFFSRNDKIYQVEDPEAPLLYSKRAILVFSILFSVVFGSVMLAINVGKVQSATKAIMVVLYGLVFTIILAVVAQNLNSNTGLAVVFGCLGALSMEYLFWRPYIGNTTQYRVKPIWIPLVIGLAIAIPLIVLIIYAGTL
jgi:hypothetical protein